MILVVAVCSNCCQKFVVSHRIFGYVDRCIHANSCTLTQLIARFSNILRIPTHVGRCVGIMKGGRSTSTG